MGMTANSFASAASTLTPVPTSVQAPVEALEALDAGEGEGGEVACEEWGVGGVRDFEQQTRKAQPALRTESSSGWGGEGA